jgi:nucleoside-diphosphate-sugar epimerase
MKTILLTGSSGFLGQILNSELKKQFKVHSLGRNKTSDIVCDLSKAVPPISLVFDIVVHVAGKAHSVPRCKSEKDEFNTVNFEGTKKLCEGLSSDNCLPRSFIFISSVAVYGLESGELIDESSPLNGTSPYAQSKILAEEWLQQWAAENDITLSILRLPLIVGFNPPGNLRAMIKGINSGRYVSIGKATARKSMVWAGDIACVIPQLAEKGGIYNLTDGYHPSFDELEFGIASALKRKAPLKIPLRMAKGIAFLGNFLGSSSPINSDKLKKIISTLTFDDTKAKTLLNWRPNSVLDKLPSII